MTPVGSIAVKLFGFRRGHNSAVVRRLEAKMCKELKTTLLRLLPPTSNGPATHQDVQTGTFYLIPVYVQFGSVK